jgi:hypothetical protein
MITKVMNTIYETKIYPTAWKISLLPMTYEAKG